MSTGHLREMVMYQSGKNGELTKNRLIVPTFHAPAHVQEVFQGPDLLYYSSIVFSPEGTLLPIWGLIMIVTIVYQALFVPFSVGFDLADTHFSLVTDFLCTVIFMIDIGISCNTGFYKKGLLITSRKAIMGRYARSWLFWDVISSFPYDWMMQGPFTMTSTQSGLQAPSLIRMVKIGRMLRSLRLVRVAKVQSHLFHLKQRLMDSKFAFLFTSCYLLAIMLGIAHWIACGFFYVSQLSETVDNWVVASELQDSHVIDQYIAALYWAITTLTTTGYGDIVPINFEEKIYCVMCMVVSAGSFSVIIGKIGASIAVVDRDAQEHKELTLAMTRYLKQADVPSRVIYRAVRYMDYALVTAMQETKTSRKVLDQRILNNFSEPLKNEISECIYGPMISSIPMFQRFDHNLISQLSRMISIEIFAQDDVIFQSSDTSSEVYFIEKGNVEIFHQDTEHTFVLLQVKDIQNGDHFGELAFFTNSPRCASARCMEFCELLSLKQDIFLALLTPNTRYQYNTIQAQFAAKDFHGLGLACYLCFQSSHLATNCPDSRIQVDKEKTRKKWLNKRIYQSRSVPVRNANPNYERRDRVVWRQKRYSIANTKRDSSFQKLKGANFMLSKQISRQQTQFKEEEEQVNGPKELGKETEYCRVASEEMLFSGISTGQEFKFEDLADDEGCSSASSEMQPPEAASSSPIPSLSSVFRVFRKRGHGPKHSRTTVDEA